MTDSSDSSKALKSADSDSLSWGLVRTTFNSLMDLPVEERARRLQSLHNENRPLAMEVNSLLEFDHRRDAVSGTEVPPSDFRTGELIDGFRLVFPLSVSPKTEVWKAIDDGAVPGSSNHEVAIKFLKRDDSDPVSARRFEQEARFLSRFDHPNIATFVTCGLTKSGQPWLATRFVSGDDIVNYCQRNNCDVRSRLELVIQVCKALEYAHRFLVVHRDIKPQNVLVDHSGRPIVIDFGISKQLLPESTSVGLTQTGQRPMTPAYASPEQLRGDPVSTATDVYATGLVLYQLMTGLHPYSARAHAQSLPLFDRVISSTPDSPETIGQANSNRQQLCIEGPRELEAETLPPKDVASEQKLIRDLAPVILKALEKRPEGRFGSVAEFRGAIERAIRGETGRIAGTEPRKFTGWAIAAVLLSMCVGLAMGWLLKGAGGVDADQSMLLHEIETMKALSEGRLDFEGSRSTFHELSLPIRIRGVRSAIDQMQFSFAREQAVLLKEQLKELAAEQRRELAEGLLGRGASGTTFFGVGQPKQVTAQIAKSLLSHLDRMRSNGQSSQPEHSFGARIIG